MLGFSIQIRELLPFKMMVSSCYHSEMPVERSVQADIVPANSSIRNHFRAGLKLQWGMIRHLNIVVQ